MTAQGPVKEQQPHGMSHRGGAIIYFQEGSGKVLKSGVRRIIWEKSGGVRVKGVCNV